MIHFSFKFILSCQQFDNCSNCLPQVWLTPEANLQPASLTPVANLRPISLTLVTNLLLVSRTLAKLVEKFASGVVDTGGAP